MIAPLQVEVGKPVTFDGYAEDYGKPIVSVEFSLDNGEHWTAFDVSGSVANTGIGRFRTRPSSRVSTGCSCAR